MHSFMSDHSMYKQGQLSLSTHLVSAYSCVLDPDVVGRLNGVSVFDVGSESEVVSERRRRKTKRCNCIY